MIPQVELFSLVFWNNSRHKKYISKLTDLNQSSFFMKYFEIRIKYHDSFENTSLRSLPKLTVQKSNKY